jgi:phosphonate transport system substrate-binding protein
VTAKPLIFACDVNLGFPDSDPEWAAFFRDHGWRVANYDDVGQLTEILRAHEPSAAFLPAANYYYLKSDPYYAGLAMGLAVKTAEPTVNSVLVVPRTAAARSVLDLKGKRLGDINSYCTTSYFSPAILLSGHHIALAPGSTRSMRSEPAPLMQPWSKKASGRAGLKTNQPPESSAASRNCRRR